MSVLSSLITYANDPHFDDNHATVNVPLIVSPALVDISVSADPVDVVPFGPYQRTLTIRNSGTSPARDLRVYVESFSYPPQHVIAGSSQWTCVSDSPEPGPRTMCATSDPLLPGRSTTLTLAFDPKFAGNYSANATAVYSGGHDRDELDNGTSLNVSIGTASDYESVLLPILASNVPGAAGKVWSTTLMLHTTEDGLPLSGWSESDLIVGPTEHFQLLWPELSNTPGEGAPHGMVVYLDKRAAADATFSLKLSSDPNALLFDTGATQVPIVRGIAHRPNMARILGTTFLPTHRYTLRIYDASASQDATATVRLVDDDDVWKEITVPLIAPANQRFANAHQPVFPSYAEIGDDVLQDFRIYNYNEPLLEITSSNPNAHLWAMLVAVDNATQQVTFSSPQ